MGRTIIPYADVAEFVKNYPSRTGHAVALAKSLDIPVSRAHRWIQQTRKMGLLPVGGGSWPCRHCGGTGVRQWRNPASARWRDAARA